MPCRPLRWQHARSSISPSFFGRPGTAFYFHGRRRVAAVAAPSYIADRLSACPPARAACTGIPAAHKARSPFFSGLPMRARCGRLVLANLFVNSHVRPQDEHHLVSPGAACGNGALHLLHRTYFVDRASLILCALPPLAATLPTDDCAGSNHASCTYYHNQGTTQPCQADHSAGRRNRYISIWYF